MKSKEFLLGTHAWQLQSKKGEFLLGTDIWQLINKNTFFDNKTIPYPQMVFYYLLERGAFLKRYEMEIKELKRKLNLLLLERMKYVGKD